MARGKSEVTNIQTEQFHDLSKKIQNFYKENSMPPAVTVNGDNNGLNQQHRHQQQQYGINSRKSASRQSFNCEQQSSQAAIMAQQINGTQKRLSMSDVSDMLFEFYKANVAKAPKSHNRHQNLRHSSPSAAEGSAATIAAIAPNGATEYDETTATVAASTAATTSTASKNVNGDEMANKCGASTRKSLMSFHPRIKYSNVINKLATAAAAAVAAAAATGGSGAGPCGDLINASDLNVSAKQMQLSAIPTSVVVPPQPPLLNVNALIPTSTPTISHSPPIVSAAVIASVIKSSPPSAAPLPPPPPPPPPPQSSSQQTVIPGSTPAAAAIAAALLRDGYHNFHQQLRAQEILKQQQQQQPQSSESDISSSSHCNEKLTSSLSTTKNSHIYESFMHNKDTRSTDYENSDSEMNDGDGDGDDDDDDDGDDDDEEDEGRYNDFDDIHLIEGGGSGGGAGNGNAAKSSTFGSHLNLPNNLYNTADYMSDESQKYMIAAQAQALRNLEFSLTDYGNNSLGEEPTYECRHCGKKYRWKSTLRRHENVECGGKEPSHQCPYCPYKSKQRGNLGVHVRKHHSNLPQLASKRRSKYSQKIESHDGNSSRDKLTMDSTVNNPNNIDNNSNSRNATAMKPEVGLPSM